MSFSDKVKQIIGSVAPLLGTAIGGPFGPIASALLSKALGTPAGDDKAIETALTNGDPDALLKLRQADNDFKLQMEQLGIQRDQLELQDVANARAREISVRDFTPRNLAYILLCGTMVLIACMLFGFTKAESAIAGSLIGYLISECKSALQYYFGTTRASQGKDETIAEIAKMP